MLNYPFKDDPINNYLIMIIKCLFCPLLQFVVSGILDYNDTTSYSFRTCTGNRSFHRYFLSIWIT